MAPNGISIRSTLSPIIMVDIPFGRVILGSYGNMKDATSYGIIIGSLSQLSRVFFCCSRVIYFRPAYALPTPCLRRCGVFLRGDYLS